MSPHELRERLDKLTRSELERISEQVFGTPNTSLKNKGALIDVLLVEKKRVAELLGIKLGWIQRNNIHVYGAIGIASLVLTGAAFWYSVSSTSPVAPIDDLRRQEVLDWVADVRTANGIIQSEPTGQRIDVDIVPEPTAEGFELTEHRVSTDLRSFQAIPSVDQREKRSAIVQQIHQSILNVSNAPVYRLTAHTSGIDVYASSDTHAGRLRTYASNERRQVATYPVAPRIIELDVSDDPKDYAFPIHVSKTYWNAFQNPDQSWVGTTVELETRSISYLVVFPEDRPYTSFDLFVNDENGNRIDLPDENYVLEDPRQLWLWWNIVNPQTGHGYNIDWEW